MFTDLSVALLFGPDGDEDAAAHSQDPRQLPERPDAPVTRRQVTASSNGFTCATHKREQ